MRLIDLFCGAGGLSLGLRRAGFTPVLALDAWDVAVETHNRNLGGHARVCDLSDAAAALEAARDVGADMVAGGPPCTDFSSAGRRVEGARADLTVAFARFVAARRPRRFLMENVPLALRSRSFAEAREILSHAGYGMTSAVLDASLCGVPQARKRLFLTGLLGARDGFMDGAMEPPEGTVPMTLRRWCEENGRPLPFEAYYRHPRTYGRRAVFGVDEPAPTMRGVNRPVPATYRDHPGDAAPARSVRPLTPAERAMVQGFPEDWRWPGSEGFPMRGGRSAVEQMVGNAVPVGLAEWVGRAILRDEAARARSGQAAPGESSLATAG